MNRRSLAIKQRWPDPDYRERQTEANRRAAEERKAFFAANPLARRLHGQAVRVSWRKRKRVG